MGSFNFLIFLLSLHRIFIYAPYIANHINEFHSQHTRYIESTLSIDAVPMSSFPLTAFGYKFIEMFTLTASINLNMLGERKCSNKILAVRKIELN